LFIHRLAKVEASTAASALDNCGKRQQPCHIAVYSCYIKRMTHPNTAHLPIETRFQPGRAANPPGRPRGVDARAKNAASASLDVWERLVEQSLDGNLDAAALVLEHLRSNVSPGRQRGSPAGKTADAAMGFVVPE
jgi:hypothetical protein